MHVVSGSGDGVGVTRLARHWKHGTLILKAHSLAEARHARGMVTIHVLCLVSGWALCALQFGWVRHTDSACAVKESVNNRHE